MLWRPPPKTWDSIQGETESKIMTDKKLVDHPIYNLPGAEIDGFDSLAELALDMRWSWNHSADKRWRAAHLFFMEDHA